MKQASPFFRPVQQALIIIFITFALTGIGIGLYTVRWILLATLIGVGLGVIISPMMAKLRWRFHIPHAINALILLSVMMGITIGIGYVIYILVADQIAPFLGKWPEFMDAARKKLYELSDGSRWLQAQIKSIQFNGFFENTAHKFISGVQTGIVAIGGVFFVIAVGLYLAVNPRDYLKGLLSVFPKHMRPKTENVLRESAKTLRRWFVAQLIAMSAVGTLTGFGLWLVGVEYWFVLGLLTAILDIIPYIGPILASGVGAVVTLGSDPNQTIWVLGVYFVTQQIEGDLIIPLVMKGRIRLPPIQLMTVMLIFGHWFGLVGIFVAPPLFAVMRTIYLMTYVPKMNEQTVAPSKQEIPPTSKSA